MLYDKIEVEVIKLAVSNMEALGQGRKYVLLNSISWLREKYEQTSEKVYLYKAVWHIYAYLELGFLYSEGAAEFGRILEYLEQDAKAVFPMAYWDCKKVKLTRGNVSRLLGRWNPRCHSMKINDAVTDIIQKVSDKEVGQYTYFSGKVISQEKEKVLWEHTFRLLIDSEDSVFYDVNQNKYYLFEG